MSQPALAPPPRTKGESRQNQDRFCNSVSVAILVSPQNLITTLESIAYKHFNSAAKKDRWSRKCQMKDGLRCAINLAGKPNSVRINSLAAMKTKGLRFPHPGIAVPGVGNKARAQNVEP